jgi:hypothetical protein
MLIAEWRESFSYRASIPSGVGNRGTVSLDRDRSSSLRSIELMLHIRSARGEPNKAAANIENFVLAVFRRNLTQLRL